jgi:hypothetical protein
MRILDRNAASNTKMKHHCFRRGLEAQKRRRKYADSSLGQEERLLLASSEFGVSQYSVFCPTRRLRNRCCQFVVAACDIATRLGMSS